MISTKGEYVGVNLSNLKLYSVAPGPMRSSNAWVNCRWASIWTRSSVSLGVKLQAVSLYKICPLDFNILNVIIGPTSVAGPKYCPRIILLSGNMGVLSRNITQSYHPNLLMWLMSAVVPFIIVSCTRPFVMYILFMELDQINASSSMQWSHKTLGEPVRIIFRDTPLFSSWMLPSAACIHGE